MISFVNSSTHTIDDSPLPDPPPPLPPPSSRSGRGDVDRDPTERALLVEAQSSSLYDDRDEYKTAR